MGFAHSKTHPMPDEIQHIYPICDICMTKNYDNIPLHCGHNFHTTCITDWWEEQNIHTMQCPTCRACTYDCFMEVSKNKESPVGFYWNEGPSKPSFLLRNKSCKSATCIMRLPSIELRKKAY